MKNSDYDKNNNNNNNKDNSNNTNNFKNINNSNIAIVTGIMIMMTTPTPIGITYNSYNIVNYMYNNNNKKLQ